MPYLSASAVVVHYEEALYQVNGALVLSLRHSFIPGSKPIFYALCPSEGLSLRTRLKHVIQLSSAAFCFSSYFIYFVLLFLARGAIHQSGFDS